MISSAAVKKLQAIAKRYMLDVPAPVPGNWENKSDGDLWASVLVQIAVIGSAASGTALNAVLSEKQPWYERLVAMSRTERAKEIHQRLREAGVRYASGNIDKCRKTAAATYNFDVLEVYGGPRAYFSKIAEIPDEHWCIAVVGDELSYIKNKGARDLLIGLGMVNRAIAFDSRLIKILEHVGLELPSNLYTNKPKYKALERELLEKVCAPCGISGGHFDRILFSKYKEIIV